MPSDRAAELCARAPPLTLTLTRTRTLTLTLGNPEPCHLVYTWLVKELVLRRKAGGIATDAPVVSRIYQVKGWG